MNPITELYRLLFGRSAMADGTVIEMAEHGRAGGVSTGQPFKFIDKLIYMTLMDFASGSSPVYIGKAIPATATSSALWQIKKLSYDANGNLSSIKLADGDTNFDNIWDNRSSLSYS